jgi:hypothetical protein
MENEMDGLRDPSDQWSGSRDEDPVSLEGPRSDFFEITFDIKCEILDF